jgi:hypothetical protein
MRLKLMPFVPVPISVPNRHLKVANRFWGQYGIQMAINKVKEVDRPDLRELDFRTYNLTLDAMKRANPNSVIVLLVARVQGGDEEATGGLTAESRAGFALTGTSTPATLAHELGHVMWGLEHVFWSTNIMNKQISENDPELDTAYASQEQVDTSRTYVQEKNRTNWGP